MLRGFWIKLYQRAGMKIIKHNMHSGFRKIYASFYNFSIIFQLVHKQTTKPKTSGESILRSVSHWRATEQVQV